MIFCYDDDKCDERLISIWECENLNQFLPEALSLFSFLQMIVCDVLFSALLFLHFFPRYENARRYITFARAMKIFE